MTLLSEPPYSLRRALVLEDDDSMAEFIASVMVREGFQVDVERDGLAGLRRCQAENFAMIVADVRMPRLSGLSFFSNLRLTVNASTPVVVISAIDDPAIRRQAVELGARAFLQKPFDAEQLVAAITPGA